MAVSDDINDDTDYQNLNETGLLWMSPENCSIRSKLISWVLYLGIVYCPLLMIIGTVINILVILVIRKSRHMSHSKQVFTLLAAADTCVLWVNPLRYWLLFVYCIDLRLLNSSVCILHTFLTYFIREIATWILLLMTFERYLFAKWPYKSQISYTRTPKTILWTSIFIILCAKNSSIFFKLETLQKSGQGNSTSSADIICDSSDERFRQIFFISTLIVYSVIPSILLLFFNITLIRIISTANKKRRIMTYNPNNNNKIIRNSGSPKKVVNFNSNCENDMSKRAVRTSGKPSLSAKSSATNRLLIPVCIIHLILTLPQCIFEIIEAAFKWKSTHDPETGDKIIWSTGITLVFVSSLNNGINGVIYFLSSRLFRQNLYKLFRCSDLRGSNATSNRHGKTHEMTSNAANTEFHRPTASEQARIQLLLEATAEKSHDTKCLDNAIRKGSNTQEEEIQSSMLQNNHHEQSCPAVRIECLISSV